MAVNLLYDHIVGIPTSLRAYQLISPGYLSSMLVPIGQTTCCHSMEENDSNLTPWGPVTQICVSTGCCRVLVYTLQLQDG
jgi:hypothetical protein